MPFIDCCDHGRSLVFQIGNWKRAESLAFMHMELAVYILWRHVEVYLNYASLIKVRWRVGFLNMLACLLACLLPSFFLLFGESMTVMDAGHFIILIFILFFPFNSLSRLHLSACAVVAHVSHDDDDHSILGFLFAVCWSPSSPR